MGFALLTLNGILPAAEPSPARVVFNEIMYHPSEGADNLQFIELHNLSSNRVELSGWSVRNGLQFVFPRRTGIAPGGYAVICRDIAAFKNTYGVEANLAGIFAGKLSRKVFDWN